LNKLICGNLLPLVGLHFGSVASWKTFARRFLGFILQEHHLVDAVDRAIDLLRVKISMKNKAL